MTAAEQLMERGRQQGLDRGREQGSREILLNQLGTRFGALPDAVTERVAAANMAQLLAWSTRVLTAATLDDVFVS